MATDAVRRRLGRYHVAGRMGWPRRRRLAAAHLQRGASPLRRRGRRVRGRYRDGRADDHHVGDARAAGTVPARHAAAATTSGASSSPNPAPVPTSPACEPRRYATATSGSSTARRCGPRARSTATGVCCSRARIPTCRSTGGSPRSSSTCARPGIDVRPLRQITGLAHFNEVFLSDVRVPDALRLGAEGDGWRVANTMLSNERAFIGGGGRTSFREILTLAQKCGANDDPVLRQELAQCFTRMQVIKWLGWRARSRKDQGLGPEASVLKLAASRRQELDGNLVVALQGSRRDAVAAMTRCTAATGSRCSSASGAVASAAAPSRCSATSSANACSRCRPTCASTRSSRSGTSRASAYLLTMRSVCVCCS